MSDLEDATATTCQRNTLLSQGRVTYFKTQGDKGHKRAFRLKITAPLGSDIYNSSFYSLNEIDELKTNPDWSNPDEVSALRGFYPPLTPPCHMTR